MELTKSQKLLYTIIREANGIDNKIKLAKLQYFSDFIHYAFNDVSISGEESIYEKRAYGPLARSFNTDLKALISFNLIDQKGKYEFIAKSNDDILLDGNELNTVQYVVSKYLQYTPEILVDITHKQIPYLSAGEGGIVEYDTAYNLVEEYPDYKPA